jgi:hypothetical protein
MKGRPVGSWLVKAGKPPSKSTREPVGPESSAWRTPVWPPVGGYRPTATTGAVGSSELKAGLMGRPFEAP